MLEVADDGHGFDTGREGAGLRGMRERASLVGGDLTLDQHADGGTTVRLAVPVARHDRPARMLLADDHALVRRGVRLILDQEPDLTVVAEAGDGAEAVELARSTEVDLVVLDIAMPRMTGLQAAREIGGVRRGASRRGS